MKTVSVAVIAALALAGCAQSKVIDGKKYEPYGLVNADGRKDDGIRYEVPFGGIAVGVIFVETIIAPLYVVGWDLYQPVEKKQAVSK